MEEQVKQNSEIVPKPLKQEVPKPLKEVEIPQTEPVKTDKNVKPKKASLIEQVLEKFKAQEKAEYKTVFEIKPILDIPKLPDTKDLTQIDVKYKVIDPYVSIHIYWDQENKEIIYKVEEPELNELEKKQLNIIEEGLIELINISFINISDEKTVIEYLEKNLKILLDELSIKTSIETFKKFMYYIWRDFIGMNEIEPLLRDYYIEDIECNGANSPIYIVHRKYQNIKTTLIYEDITHLIHFVEKLAQKCSKYVSYANPLLDGVLPSGERVNATYTEDVSSKGPTFTIRKFTKEPWTPIKIIQFRSVSPEIFAYLWMAIEHSANIMIIGPTGSGKTSFLNAIAFFIPPAARVVSIEDTRELNLKHENWLPSVARAGLGSTTITGEKHGEVSLFALLKESFRQRPDYIIVGEVRGKEAFVLFQGMASGHSSFGTMHADSAETMIKRLETAPINLSASLVESLDIIAVMIPAKVKGKQVRRLREITEVVSITESGNTFNQPFQWDPAADRFLFKTASKVFHKIMKRTGMNEAELLREFRLRTYLLLAMTRQNIVGFKEVQDIINEYYKDPLTVLRRFQIIR
ncbi:MAG: type II/IV secretion system ATPase subunit [archaeon]